MLEFMSGGRMDKGNAIKRTLVIVLFSVALAAGLYWSWAFAYCDWLRFYSPDVPNPTTGQVMFMKAVKGVFYVTRSQHFWGAEMLLPAWVLLAASTIFLRLSKFEQMSWSNRDIVVGGLIGWVCSFLMAALFAFGDQVMAIVYSGSLALPPEPNLLRSTGVDALFAVFVIGILLINTATWVGKSVRIRRRKDR